MVASSLYTDINGLNLNQYYVSQGDPFLKHHTWQSPPPLPPGT